MRKKTGRGMVDKIIDNLPVEMHIPGYKFCGPGTKLHKKLSQKGINKLDDACKEHDIEYDKYRSGIQRKNADKILRQKAWSRFRSKDSSVAEKTAALAVSGIMKAKKKLGMGLTKKIKKVRAKKVRTKKVCKSNTFNLLKKSAKYSIKNNKAGNLTDLAETALNAAKCSLKQMKNMKNVSSNKNVPRIIPVPKIGGVLPLIPIFAGLSALGSLMGGSAAIANAVLTTKNAKKQLAESSRHNKQMEFEIHQQRNGKVLFLRPYKTGYGLYLKKLNENQNF